ncbi:MAG TPA: hypothetical protein VJL88_08655 [Nitrospira sp.]|nr:hypothetical protein [Nitrospira sp.]
MKWLADAVLLGAVLIMVLVAPPVWAGAPEFDPDQPFKGMGQQLLESFLGQALQALDDHFEMAGSLDPKASQPDAKKSLRFKFYPNGKSKSNEHITAEGWFGPSTDAQEEEFHFRFTVPKSLTPPSPAPPENVL